MLQGLPEEQAGTEFVRATTLFYRAYGRVELSQNEMLILFFTIKNI
jgi:hypothetical protein